MKSRLVELDEFIVEYPLWGNWEVSYTDGTHLPACKYVKLGDVTIDASEHTAQDYRIFPFTFRPVTDEQIECYFLKLLEKIKQENKPKKKNKQSSMGESPEKQARRAERIIRNELAASMVRTGLLRFEFCMMENQTIEMAFQRVMRRLSEHGYLILVVDTSALRRAATSFLHKTLANVLIWTVVPVFVMIEVQRQAHELKNIWRKITEGAEPHPGKCDVIEKRPQVSTISREVNHIRQWRPVEVLTTLPEHLGQSNGESKIDRLIIESVKNLKRDRGLHQGVYLLTGDKDMASLATLENQGSLYIGVPPLPSEISSIRYDSYNDRLVLTPIHLLLWDLTQVFSTIRFENKKLSRTYELCYYSQARGGFFAHDTLEIREC